MVGFMNSFVIWAALSGVLAVSIPGRPSFAHAGVIKQFEGGSVTFMADKCCNRSGDKRTTGVSLGSRDIPPGDERWVDYWMRYHPGWIEGKGGKLPGLAGGTATTGCQAIDPQGWSTRFMWGPLRVYIYHQNRMDGCGDGVRLNVPSFPPDTWHRITQRVKVNAPGQANGEIQVWINGKQVFLAKNYTLRGNVDASRARVDKVRLSIFRGGDNPTWAVQQDTTIEFKNFYILDCQPVFRGDENSEPACGGSGPSPPPLPTPGPDCKVSGSTAWQNSAFVGQTTPFEVTYDATPSADNMNGVTGLSLNAAAAYTDLAVIMRFNSYGTIDARNGSGYAALTTVPYVAGTVYHFRVVVNPTARTYDAFVKAGSGMEVPIASNYAFRAEQVATSSVNNWGSFADTGSHTVCNVQVSSGP
jgi:hypothetical protein